MSSGVSDNDARYHQPLASGISGSMGDRPGCSTINVVPVSLHHVVIDAHDLVGLARFWSQALDWPILSEREREVVIGPADDAPVGICFMPSPGDKIVKNRVHLDLNPGPDASAEERQAEIDRLVNLGARPVDVGQRGDETWTVLADPEGNEFCVVRPKKTLTS
jgi:hypothetical protein